MRASSRCSWGRSSSGRNCYILFCFCPASREFQNDSRRSCLSARFAFCWCLCGRCRRCPFLLSSIFCFVMFILIYIIYTTKFLMLKISISPSSLGSFPPWLCSRRPSPISLLTSLPWVAGRARAWTSRGQKAVSPLKVWPSWFWGWCGFLFFNLSWLDHFGLVFYLRYWLFFRNWWLFVFFILNFFDDYLGHMLLYNNNVDKFL